MLRISQHSKIRYMVHILTKGKQIEIVVIMKMDKKVKKKLKSKKLLQLLTLLPCLLIQWQWYTPLGERGGSKSWEFRWLNSQI